MEDQSKNIKSENIILRCTEDEKEAIQKYAKEDGLTVTEYIKRLALKKVIIANRIEYNSDLRTLNFEISKVGTNINQIAKNVNRTEKFKTIDAGTINVFHLFMKDYLTKLDDANMLLKKMYKKISFIK